MTTNPTSAETEKLIEEAWQQERICKNNGHLYSKAVYPFFRDGFLAGMRSSQDAHENHLAVCKKAVAETFEAMINVFNRAYARCLAGDLNGATRALKLAESVIEQIAERGNAAMSTGREGGKTL